MTDTIRIFELPVDEIIIDPEGCSEALNRTVQRTGRKVAGLCTDGNRVFVSLTPNVGVSGTFRFAELAQPERNRIDAELTSRYTAGFAASQPNRVSGLSFADSTMKPPGMNDHE